MPKLSWYLQRASAMPPVEFPWRLWRVLRAQSGRFHHFPQAETLNGREYLDSAQGNTKLLDERAIFTPDDSDLSRWPRPWHQGCLAEADTLLHKRIRLFEFDAPPVASRPDWHRDYSSGRVAPGTYAQTLDYRSASSVGDVKVTWELSRMQYIVRLAQAWRLSGEQRYAEAVVHQVEDWIRCNPWMRGINWTSSMECALRLISWAWAIRWIADSEPYTAEFGRLVAASVHQHLAFIHRNYSLYSSANNHLIAEASGAYIASAFWAGLKCSARVREKARQHLVRECLRQNFPDGVNHEQTFGYQAFVWDLLAIAALVGRRTGDEFVAAYWQRLESMAEFIAHVMDRNGNVPNVGDQDDGAVMRLGSTSIDAHMEMVNLASVLHGRDDFLAWTEGRPTERTSWLTGTRRTSESNVQRSSRSFFNGGYHSLRFDSMSGPEVMLLVDVGPNVDSVTGVHAHADALSICLHVGGKPVIVDPGTYSYQDGPLRRYFRATAQHNTLCFGDTDQNEYLNRFLWGKRANVSLLDHQISPEGGRLSGQVSWWHGGNHVRTVSAFFKDSCIEIEDGWDGRGDAKLNFVIHPSLPVSKVGPRTCRVTLDEFFVEMEWDNGVVNVSPMRFSDRCYRLDEATRISVGLPGTSGRVRSFIRWGGT